jgi:hypothetical protein
LLTEIASHGYFVIEAEALSFLPGLMVLVVKSNYTATDVGNMKFAINWVMDGKTAKYGNIDILKLATGGLSCVVFR